MKSTISMKMVLITVLFSTNFIASASAVTAKQQAAKGMQYAELFPGLASLCDIDSPIRDLSKRKRANRSGKSKKSSGKNKTRSSIPATKVFDNLFFVGTGGVSAWVIKTSDGLILIDALNSNKQAKQYIEQGLLNLGLNPKDIKYLLIGHEHGDHYGGQEYIVSNYQPRVVMGEVAWERMEKRQLTLFSPRWGKQPIRDIAAKDGDVITLGETEVQIYATPGHTPGTISFIFPVYDNGSKHMVSLWGGTGLNYGPDENRILAYSEAAKRFGDIAKSQGVDIYMSNHPKRDGSAAWLKQLANREVNEPHPFVAGKQNAVKAYDMLHHCTYAQVLKIRADKAMNQEVKP